MRAEQEAPLAPVSVAGFRGRRVRDFDAASVAQALAAHDAEGATVLKDDDRSRVTAVRAGDANVIVKEVRKGGARRRLADALRGSPAQRGFRAGHALRSAGIEAARPLAFVERRILGVPVRSLLFSSDLRAFPTAAEHAGEAPAEALEKLCDLAIGLHRAQFSHGDLRAQHVFLCGPEARPALIDLEGVRGARQLTELQRIEALAQLNASLPDETADCATRDAAFARYTAALPFETPDARQQIIERSRARNHHWKGPRT